MGLRFQRRISIFPGVRINLSKRGASAGIGPRGADVNIGRGGVTANAGIPGTGLSYRRKLGTHGSWLGVVLLVAALAFWAGKYAADPVSARPAQQAAAAAGLPTGASSVRKKSTASGRHAAALAPGKVFVHRGGSVLRDTPKFSGRTLKKEAKGAAILLIADQGGGWAKVADGNITGWMRSSILGSAPPD